MSENKITLSQPVDTEIQNIDRKAIGEFLEYLENNKEYLETGLGAFHTDNHSNW